MAQEERIERFYELEKENKLMQTNLAWMSFQDRGAKGGRHHLAAEGVVEVI